jgi:hypothetical protein
MGQYVYVAWHSEIHLFLRYQSVPLELVGYTPQLCIDSLDTCNVDLGPSSVLRVRCCDPRFAFRGPWSGRPTTMQLAPAPSFNGGVLTRGAFAGFSEAPLARPIRPETGCKAGFSESCVVSLIH